MTSAFGKLSRIRQPPNPHCTKLPFALKDEQPFGHSQLASVNHSLKPSSL